MLKSLSTVAVAALLAFSVAGCTTSEQRTAGYGVGGAALGALAGGAIGGGRGALAGAAIGGVGGVAVGAATANNDGGGRRYCTYENRYGERYRAPCRGY
ncbi:hypothetical protein ACTJJ7_08140 [Phyllobacterium sp. 22229]|uniref:Glycine zipper domain-containing protein n=1 Tax=Phyllobacterium myrsinacearum TaxID=28101 RepID=A0A2S9JJW4_9HYPH|nr:hypothetical protein [Phyllobacterium myrsinacearum]PRD53380.1 hypothetical protein C5750_13460 [Phyllobacterium myrsinacearum]PWV87721.1 hypothetical protein DEV92_11290 [Phyllobacterium myrsinacearum]RZS82195.1 hypothetical protein EV217_3011 [Phyllobacterium myrsinacearum]RZV07818.1 hypothetical protein EV654_2495 [Phyllobacterium myrsinacearum]